MGDWIDALARWAAGGLSRREALKRIGGGLAAAALVTLVPVQQALADDDPGLAICREACGEISKAGRRGHCRTSCKRCQRKGTSAQCGGGCSCVDTTEGASPSCAQNI